LWLRSRVASRQKTIARELPDMLDMLTISVEAGMGFDSALAKLVKNSRGPLAEEFGRVLQEVQAGASRKEGLRHLAERIDVPELRSFVASIVQADMFGVSIASVLRTQATELRLRRRQRAEEDAQRAPVKMVFPLIFCILPATMIVILGPAVVRIAIVLLGY
jgi:tight adherence protein C